MLVSFLFWVRTLASSWLICLTFTCPEPRLVVQVLVQALLPCQLLLVFGKRNANCTTRTCTSMCAASQCTCFAVPAALSRKTHSTYAFKWGQDLCDLSQRSSLKRTFHCFVSIRPSQNGIEHKSLAKFCAGRGICTDVTSGAKKIALGSRICFAGTGYSWPGLFSRSLQMHTRLVFYINAMMMSWSLSRIHQHNTYFCRNVCSARFGVIVCNSAPFTTKLQKPSRTTRSVGWTAWRCGLGWGTCLPLSGLVVVGPWMRMVSDDWHPQEAVVPCKEWKSLNRLVQLQRNWKHRVQSWEKLRVQPRMRSFLEPVRRNWSRASSGGTTWWSRVVCQECCGIAPALPGRSKSRSMIPKVREEARQTESFPSQSSWSMGALRQRPTRPPWRPPRPSVPSWCARASSRSRRGEILTSPAMCLECCGASRGRSGEWGFVWSKAIQTSHGKGFLAAVSQRRRRPRRRLCGSKSCTACNARWRLWAPCRRCLCSARRCRTLGWTGTRGNNNGMQCALSVVCSAISGWSPRITRWKSWSVLSKSQWPGGRGRRRRIRRWRSPSQIRRRSTASAKTTSLELQISKAVKNPAFSNFASASNMQDPVTTEFLKKGNLQLRIRINKHTPQKSNMDTKNCHI